MAKKGARRTSRTPARERSSPRAAEGRSPAELDRLDRQLLDLILRRARAVRAAGAASQPTAWEARRVTEQRIGRLLDAAADDAPIDREGLAAVMRHIDSVCTAGLHRNRVAYLGPPYSYSHLATVKLFGEAYPKVPVASIAAVFDAVVRNDATLGLVPVENSTDGRVVDTLGMFIRHPVQVCGEVLLPIHHYLLGRSERSEITEVYSKPQALSQCRAWLARHLPQARLVEMASTTAAAQLAAEKPGAAAVASVEAGRQYGLAVIDACIEDNPNNVTRFALIGSDAPPPTGDDKTSLLFQVPHEPGALADAMAIFKRNSLNLTWIESFPLPDGASEYLFFVELEGHRDEAAVGQAIERLRKKSIRLDVLGSYPRDRA